MQKIEIAGHTLSITSWVAVIAFAWPLLTQAMEYRDTLEQAAKTAEKNEVTLDRVVVQNTEQTADIEKIADTQEEIKAALDQIRQILMERPQ